MPKIFIASIFCLLTTFTACKKYPFFPDDYSQIFLGDWNWIGTMCSNGGSYIDADSVDYSIRLIFDRDGAYHYYENDLLITSSNYSFQFDYSNNDIKHYNITVGNDVHTYFAYIIYYNNKEFLVTGEKNPDTCELYWERKN